MNSLILSTGLINSAIANDMSILIIDDRSNKDVTSNLGTKWQLVTDGVMGRLSQGQLTLDNYKGKNCLRMRGDVTRENNGGFVQIALSLSEQGVFKYRKHKPLFINVKPYTLTLPPEYQPKSHPLIHDATTTLKHTLINL